MAPLPLVQCCSPLSRTALSDAQADDLEQLFKALADRHRVKILNRLIAAGDDAVCVCEFTDSLGLKQPTVSYHLKQLAEAGLISRERRGTFAYYRLVPGALEGLGALLATPAPAAAA
jgi:ArsR family transcriptional regulator, arsenate/arsenite/antimonite-responsive transcriptional repressor